MQLEHSFTVPVGIDDAWKVLLDIERIAPCMPGAALETIDGDNFTGTVKVKLGPISLTYKGKASFVEKDEAAHRATINAQGRDARGNGTASANVTATLTDENGETKVDVVTDLDITGKPAQFGRGVMVDVGNKLIGQFADCLAGKLGGASDAPAETPATPAAPPASDTSTAAVAPAPEPATELATEATAAKKAPAKGATTAKKATAKKAAPAKKIAAAASPAPTVSAPVDTAPAGEPSLNVGSEPVAAAAPTPASEPTPAAPAPVQSGPRRIAPIEVEPIDLLEHAGPAVAKRLVPVVAAVVLLLIILRLRKR